MKKLLSVALSLVMTSFCVSVAMADITDKVDITMESTTYTLNGTFKAAEFNRIAILEVKKGDEVVLRDAIKTGLDSTINYSFEMPDSVATDVYNFYLTGYDSTAPLELTMNGEKDITYISKTDMNNALDAIDGAGASTASVIANNVKPLKIMYNEYYPYYAALSPDAKARLGVTVQAGTPYSKDIDAFERVFYKGLAMEALKDSDVSKTAQVLTDFASYYNISTFKTYSLYEGLSDYKTEIYTKWIAQLEGYENIEKTFNEAVILVKIKRANSWGEVSNIITTYDSVMPVTVSSSNLATVAKAIAGKDYNDMTALATAIKSASATTSSGGSSGGGGGSSSGSTKGDSGFTVVRAPENTTVDSYDEEPYEEEVIRIFDDMHEAKWAVEAIEFLAEKDVISGTGDGKVHPNDSVTREQFVKMVLTAFDIYKDGERAHFEDVSEDDWAYTYISYAFNKKIVFGITDTEFGIGSEISRQDMAVMITRAMTVASGFELPNDLTFDFTDGDNIADYATDSIAYLATRGVINGFEDGTFRPTARATRAEAAQMLYSLLK